MVFVVVIAIVVGEYVVVVVGQPSFLSIVVASNRRCICLFGGGGERDGGRIPLDGITMADFGDFPCFPEHQMPSFLSPRYFSAMSKGGEDN